MEIYGLDNIGHYDEKRGEGGGGGGGVVVSIPEPPRGKTGNVRFYTIEKIEKQSLRPPCYLFG